MSKLMQKVLVVDDEEDILELLQYNLSKEGYDVKVAENGRKALEIAKDFQPQLIILDIMMPVMDGVETCRLLRENPSLKDCYIIFLTARSEEYSEIAAFDAGANDYLNKPIKPRALLSRISAFFKRIQSAQKNSDRVEYPDLVIDRNSYTVMHKGNQLILPKKEFELLSYLAANPNKVFSREQLLSEVWGSDVYVLARTVDVHIRKVREKIGDDYISTVKGVGYKFEPIDE